MCRLSPVTSLLRIVTDMMLADESEYVSPVTVTGLVTCDIYWEAVYVSPVTSISEGCDRYDVG